MSTQLSQIAKRAKLDRKARFTSLAHLPPPRFKDLVDGCLVELGVDYSLRDAVNTCAQCLVRCEGFLYMARRDIDLEDLPMA